MFTNGQSIVGREDDDGVLRFTRLFQRLKNAADLSVGMRDGGVEVGDMLFDYSKTALDETGRRILLDLFKGKAVETRREAMFSGQKINETEDRECCATASSQDSAVASKS